MGDLPATRAEHVAGAVLHRAGPLSATVVLAVATSALVLGPPTLWRAGVALPVLAVGVAVAWRTARAVPSHPAPLSSVGLCLVVALGHGLWALLTHAEQVVLRRDAGSYALYAHQLATRHTLSVDVSVEALGGAAAMADPALTVGSPGFYEVGSGAGVHVVPQFMLGAPAWFSLGYWADGFPGLFAMPALAGAFAVLAVAGLTARLVGPRWASLAAGAVALTQPVLHASRSTYSEPLALLLAVAGACVVVDATRESGRARAHRLGLVAGLLVGLAGLVRVDALRECALLVPVIAVMAVVRHPAARPLAVGLAVGTGVSAVAALGLSRPYVSSVAASLVPLALGAVVLSAGSVVAVLLLRDRAPAPGGRAWWWAPAAVVAVALVLASRPWWLVVRQDPDDPGSRVVAGLQLRQGLPVDGGRTYAERSLEWVVWWVGVPVTVLALGTFAVLAWRAAAWWARQRSLPVPDWLAPAFVALGSTVLTLYRPGITPDHPWADRRLVPVVLPAVLLAATAAVAWGVREARRRLPATLYVLVAVTGVAALLVPAALATWPVAGPAARTEVGEVDAAHAVCAALGPRDVVLATDTRGANEWPQLVRGVCGHPAASFTRAGELAEAAPRVAQRILRAGYRPVLLAAGDDRPLRLLGLEPEQVASLSTREDRRELVRRPDGTAPLDVAVWLAPWTPSTAG